MTLRPSTGGCYLGVGVVVMIVSLCWAWTMSTSCVGLVDIVHRSWLKQEKERKLDLGTDGQKSGSGSMSALSVTMDHCQDKYRHHQLWQLSNMRTRNGEREKLTRRMKLFEWTFVWNRKKLFLNLVSSQTHFRPKECCCLSMATGTKNVHCFVHIVLSFACGPFSSHAENYDICSDSTTFIATTVTDGQGNPSRSFGRSRSCGQEVVGMFSEGGRLKTITTRSAQLLITVCSLLNLNLSYKHKKQKGFWNVCYLLSSAANSVENWIERKFGREKHFEWKENVFVSQILSFLLSLHSFPSENSLFLSFVIRHPSFAQTRLIWDTFGRNRMDNGWERKWRQFSHLEIHSFLFEVSLFANLLPVQWAKWMAWNSLFEHFSRTHFLLLSPFHSTFSERKFTPGSIWCPLIH